MLSFFARDGGSRSTFPPALDLRRKFSAYDAAYVALAERLGGTLLTDDQRFARAARLLEHPTTLDTTEKHHGSPPSSSSSASDG